MAQTIVTAPMQRKAEALADLVPTFSRGRSKANGQQFIVVPSSTKPLTVAHYSSHLGCTCLGFNRRGVCTHQQACLIAVQRAEAAIREQTQPVQKSAEAIYQERQATAQKPRRTYAELHPVCSINGCDEDALGKSGKCLDHLTDQQRAA